ncbi:phosphate ABC transporter substrate-binding protein PstS [Aerosakkonema sp. BLCC-F183]|uniref:phosphate ABC transporter substrate-binding protein PstS n=1 Tax=Aerosakkonema sp. BLCC-F183 TaxID=3342834 RepID=UPI0035BA888C
MIFSSTTLRRAVMASVATVGVVAGAVYTATSQTAVTLNGAGATFPAPLYQRYFAQFSQSNPNTRVNYQAVGSGAGIRQMIAGTVDFAGSDVAMKDNEIGQVGRGVVFVPTAGGPVAVVYNLPGVNNLKLSREALPAIFSGQITNWNDPRIASANAGVSLPNQPIRLAVRADSSGTSFIFSNHLSAINPYFRGRVTASTTPNWPGNPLRGQGNPGVAQSVKNTRGAIGYVEFAYAKTAGLQMAQLQNKGGAYIAPSMQAANEALESVNFNPDFRVNFSSLGDPAQGYPISGLTWIMVYKQYTQPGKADAVKKLVQWMMTSGQQINDDLNYTRIPPSVANRVVQAVNSSVK